MLQGSTFGNSWGGPGLDDIWDLFLDPYNHRVVFDGPNRYIYLLDGYGEFSVSEHVYDAWKEWIRLRDFTKYPEALQVVGGEPISPTEALGATFFLVNGWKMKPIDGTEAITIDGNIFSDDLQPATDPDDNGNLNISYKVSTLTNTIIVDGGGVGDAPTVEEIDAQLTASHGSGSWQQGLTTTQDNTLSLAYEEARRARAMAVNNVDIAKTGSGTGAVDTITVYDDDGITPLYVIRVLGEDADNRFVQYVKPY